MDLKALHKISYGLYIITSRKENRHNGQVANTVFQISTDTLTIAISLNKNTLTIQFVKESKLFTVSVLAHDVPLSLISQFGFKSGREVDKFKGINYKQGSTGVCYLVDGILAYIEAEVIQVVDAGTHDIFIGKVTGAETLSEGEPLTYAYYHQVKKGGIPKTAPLPQLAIKENSGQSKVGKYVCSVCGYVYDPETGDPEHGVPPGTPFEALPEDWTCPLCGFLKDHFAKDE